MTQETLRLTMSQALVKYLANQYVARDGHENRFFAGCGASSATAPSPASAKPSSNTRQIPLLSKPKRTGASARLGRLRQASQPFGGIRLRFVNWTRRDQLVNGRCCSHRQPHTRSHSAWRHFAERIQAPVLQQLESEHSQDISVNDCFKPVSRYWDRINRPEQIITALPEAMRVLTSRLIQARSRSACRRISRLMPMIIPPRCSRNASGRSRAIGRIVRK